MGWRASSHWSVGGARQATICSNRLDVPMRESALAPRGLSWVFSPQPLMPLHRPVASPPWGGGEETKLAHQLETFGATIDGSWSRKWYNSGDAVSGPWGEGTAASTSFQNPIPDCEIHRLGLDRARTPRLDKCLGAKAFDRSTPRSMFERNSWGQKLAHKAPTCPPNTMHRDVLMPTEKPAYPDSQPKPQGGREGEREIEREGELMDGLSPVITITVAFHPDFGEPLWPSLPFASRPRTQRTPAGVPGGRGACSLQAIDCYPDRSLGFGCGCSSTSSPPHGAQEKFPIFIISRNHLQKQGLNIANSSQSIPP